MENQNAERAIANSETSVNAANRMDAANAENVLIVPVHGSVDCCHPFADDHHLRAYVGGYGDGSVVRVQGEERVIILNGKRKSLPGVFGDGFGGVVLFHGEAAAVFRVAHGVELDEDDAALAGALRAGAD